MGNKELATFTSRNGNIGKGSKYSFEKLGGRSAILFREHSKNTSVNKEDFENFCREHVNIDPLSAP